MAGASVDNVTREYRPEACYLANLEALYRRDVELAARIDTLAFAALPAIEAARDGGATVRCAADDGRAVYVHSRYRPVEEAARLVGQLPEVDHPTFFVSGSGLGYVVVELERRYDQPLVIVAEDDPAMLKAALCLHDFTSLLDDGRLVFLTTDDPRSLHERLDPHSAVILLGLQFVALPHTRRVHAAFHERLRAQMTEFVRYARMQIITLLKTARVTFENVAYNLPAYLAGPGVEVLEGRAAGRPAVIVAAGPSLARNLDQLGQLRERAVIIAVQTVLRLLCRVGVRPHFVTSLDFHEVSTEFFRGVAGLEECTLVAEPKANWHVLDMFTGRKHVLGHDHHQVLLGDDAPPRGRLKPGTTVAHLAFYLARHLGCDPIIFVGQDLAFSEGLFYIPGSPIESVWAPELGRFQTVEMKQWERIVRNRPILRRLPDIHGRPTYTDELLTTYREQFEADFAATAQRVIQASEGGLPLAGTTVMPLREAVARYCTDPLPPGLLAPAGGTGDAAALCRRAAAQLERRIDEVEHLWRVATETSRLLERLEQLVERPREFNKLIVRVDELRTIIHKYPGMYRLVLDVSAAADLRRYSADRRLGAPAGETPHTARRRLARDREFVAAFIEGCEFLRRVLPEALRRVREQTP